MSDSGFEVPKLVGTVKLKAGQWKGDPRQLKEKIREATAQAYKKTQSEMMMWIAQNVPQKTTRLMSSGMTTLMKGVSNLYFPFELWWGFPAEVTYTYKLGPRRGQTTTFKYANFVDQMRLRGASPRKGGTIAPFIDPGKQLLLQKLHRNLKRELGDLMSHVKVDVTEGRA